MIQAASGERAFTVTTESVENLPIANRNFAGFATLVPGAIAQTGTAIAGGVFRLGGGGQNNIMMDGVSTMDTGNNGQLISDERRLDRRSEGPDTGLPGRVRALERPADLGGDQERHQPVPRLALRHRAELGLELEQLGEHRRTATRSRSRSSATGATRWADRLGSPAAPTGCSSSTATSTGRAKPAATSIASACRRRSSGRETSRRRATTTARSSTRSATTRRACRARRRTRAAASRMAACSAGFRRAACIRPA